MTGNLSHWRGWRRWARCTLLTRYAPPRSAGSGLTRASQHLGTGSLAMSSLLALAKSYPRALLLHGDSLMCCKVDGMELCVFKWDKKVLSLLSIKRVEKTAFSLANTTEARPGDLL